MTARRPQSAGAASKAASRWSTHDAAWRDPHQVVSQWQEASNVDPGLLAAHSRGRFWEAVEQCGYTLLVSREYEHLVMALSVSGGRRRISHLHLPHPNGMAVDSTGECLVIASTRNPNVLYDFAPCVAAAWGRRLPDELLGQLLPTTARYLPGCLYTHDLAFIGGRLHANAVGINAVVRVADNGGVEPVWWPRSIDGPRGPRFEQNHLQVNSIAAGRTLASSFFTATLARPGRRKPGDVRLAVDRQGVVFSGRTREVVGVGLTRPHSARLHQGEIWVDNSGYGQLGRIVAGRFEPVVQLPGWTRGLFFAGQVAFVATSRIIPQYRAYAPGLDPDHCVTGVHAVDLKRGTVVGSLLWPAGNQIFAIEGIDRKVTCGFPFTSNHARERKRNIALFSRGQAA